jgi:tRNA-dihydrouridine synthase B
MMADAARYNVDQGAQIIDINMGCPAKKICNVMAGSALMKDETQVTRILDAVVRAVPNTPVTLKFRTGWDHQHKNAPQIARIAEACGVRAIAIHGRTRSDQYRGAAEYETIALVKSLVGIPVIANGDIDSPQKAKEVLARTGADGLMIGRAAQGRPWLFGEIEHYLRTGTCLPTPTARQIHAILRQHLADLYNFYGEDTGAKIARKHISWYTKGIPGAAAFRHAMNQLVTIQTQLAATDEFFLDQAANETISEELAA